MTSPVQRVRECILNSEDPNYDVTVLSDALVVWMKSIEKEDLSEEIRLEVQRGSFSLQEGRLLLQVAAWSGTENGSAMYQTFRSWLREGMDELRIQLALSAEVVLFEPGEAKAIYRTLVNRFPHLEAETKFALLGGRGPA